MNSIVKSEERPEKPNSVVININSIVKSEDCPEKPNDVVINIIDTDSDFDIIKVCRICLEYSGSSKIKNLGCVCKGDIGDAHPSCAVRWFSLKGNRVCEVCQKLAKNISINNTNTADAYAETISRIKSFVFFTFGVYIVLLLHLIAGYCSKN